MKRPMGKVMNGLSHCGMNESRLTAAMIAAEMRDPAMMMARALLLGMDPFHAESRLPGLVQSLFLGHE